MNMNVGLCLTNKTNHSSSNPDSPFTLLYRNGACKSQSLPNLSSINPTNEHWNHEKKSGEKRSLPRVEALSEGFAHRPGA
jgi:hypothetical protein